MKQLIIVKRCLLCEKDFTPPENPNATAWAKLFCSFECSIVATMMVLQANPDLPVPKELKAEGKG